MVGVDSEGFDTATSQLRWLLVAGLGLVVIAVGVLAWVLTGRALRRSPDSPSAPRWSDRMTLLADSLVPAHDAELARLVAALNRMLARLHESHTERAGVRGRRRPPAAHPGGDAPGRGRARPARDGPGREHGAALETSSEDADQLTLIVERMLARSRSRGHAAEPVRTALAERTSGGAARPSSATSRSSSRSTLP